MRQSDRKAISNIIAVNPYVYKWQAEIEKEQERVIADLVSPAEKVVKKLIELDNRRVDLCNLKVLYGFIERGLGAEFSTFVGLMTSSVGGRLFDKAKTCIERAGYDTARVTAEFEYLFNRIPKAKSVRKENAERNSVQLAVSN